MMNDVTDIDDERCNDRTTVMNEGMNTIYDLVLFVFKAYL